MLQHTFISFLPTHLDVFSVTQSITVSATSNLLQNNGSKQTIICPIKVTVLPYPIAKKITNTGSLK